MAHPPAWGGKPCCTTWQSEKRRARETPIGPGLSLEATTCRPKPFGQRRGPGPFGLARPWPQPLERGEGPPQTHLKHPSFGFLWTSILQGRATRLGLVGTWPMPPHGLVQWTPQTCAHPGPLARQTTHQAVMSRLHGRRQPTRCRQSRVAHMPLRSERPTSRNRQALPPCCAVVAKRPAQISTTAPKRSSPSRGVVRGACPFGLRRFPSPNAQACWRQGMRGPGPLNHPRMLLALGPCAALATCSIAHRRHQGCLSSQRCVAVSRPSTRLAVSAAQGLP